jgi:hypothetical protein
MTPDGPGDGPLTCLNSWAKLKRCRTSGSAPFSTISVLTQPDLSARTKESDSQFDSYYDAISSSEWL